MMLLGRGVILSVALGATVLATSSGAVAQGGPPVSAAWTLRGRSLRVVPAPRQGPRATRFTGSASFHVILPAGIRQGRGGWYLLRLRGTLVVRRTGAQSQISVSVNRRAALQLIVGMSPRIGGAPAVPVIDELDLVQGERVFAVSRRREMVDETNYVQLRGLKGGENTITVTEEVFGKTPVVSSVVVQPGSGLYRTPLGPSTLSVHVPRTIRIARGKTALLPVTLVDSGADAQHTQVRVSGGLSTVQVGGASSVQLGGVSAHKARHFVFALRGAQPGTATVTVSVSSNGGQWNGSTKVVVYRFERPLTTVLLASGLVLVPVAALLFFALRRPHNDTQRV